MRLAKTWLAVKQLPSSALRQVIEYMLCLLWFCLLSSKSSSGWRDEFDTGNMNAIGFYVILQIVEIRYLELIGQIYPGL